MCSLYESAEDLEMLINNLEYNFSVIALSETWTSKEYQPFYATQGTTIKSDCEINVKKGLKFKSRKDPHLTHHDDENEFHSCWIKILNEK